MPYYLERTAHKYTLRSCFKSDLMGMKKKYTQKCAHKKNRVIRSILKIVWLFWRRQRTRPLLQQYKVNLSLSLNLLVLHIRLHESIETKYIESLFSSMNRATNAN